MGQQRAQILTEILGFDGWKVTRTFFESASQELEIASPRTVAKLRYNCRPKWFRTLSDISKANCGSGFVTGVLLVLVD